MRSPAATPREWRESFGEEARISSFLLRERCREEEEEEMV